jgi:2-polyprenyl-6-methoxyphenol hydroxylase-like FAD-dependent oxidoreductase
MEAAEDIHDLVVVGAGSVGLTMAAAWARLGRTCVLVERHEQQYGLPRAGHIDHEIMRILQALGAEEPVVEDSYETAYYRWVNTHGETLLEFPWGEEGVSGWHSDFMQNSAILEASLLQQVRRSRGVELALGWQVEALRETPDFVEITLDRVVRTPDDALPQPTGERRVLRARYVVAADGANSQIRRLLGIEREDLGFNEKWLVVDARKKRDVGLDFDSGQVCDPRQPITILPLGKHHRRWEWHIKPGEDPASYEEPERAWQLLADLGIGPDDVEPVRQLVYTFEARLARHWRTSRVFLAGDAAHTMPPFMGQGMCSGMRDAFNLAWKLDLVTRGAASVALLDTYQHEREPHVRDWTVISLESGRLSCVTDPDEAQRRDDAFRAGYRPPIPEFPQLVGGVLHRAADDSVTAPAGELGVQGRVQQRGVIGLMDDVVPTTGFVLLTLDPVPDLGADERAALADLRCRVVRLSGECPDGEDNRLFDVDGTYQAWFDARGVRAVLVRPDFYVYGGVTDLSGVGELVLGAARDLDLRPATSLGSSAPGDPTKEEVANA